MSIDLTTLKTNGPKNIFGDAPLDTSQAGSVQPDSTSTPENNDPALALIMFFLKALLGESGLNGEMLSGIFGGTITSGDAPSAGEGAEAANSPDSAGGIKGKLDVNSMLKTSDAMPKIKAYLAAHKGEKVEHIIPVDDNLIRVTESFGAPRPTHTHAGLDIAPEHSGDKPPIIASADGIVLFSGKINGYGNAVIVAHGDGSTSLYGHLSSISASVGEELKQGEKLGMMGNSGASEGVHLHYEQIEANTKINPKFEGLVNGLKEGMKLNPRQVNHDSMVALAANVGGKSGSRHL